jgi:hypothetical protein
MSSKEAISPSPRVSRGCSGESVRAARRLGYLSPQVAGLSQMRTRGATSPNLSPFFTGRGRNSRAARISGEGRGTAVQLVIVHRVVHFPTRQPFDRNRCNAWPLTRRLRFATSPTSPRKGRGEVKKPRRSLIRVPLGRTHASCDSRLDGVMVSSRRQEIVKNLLSGDRCPPLPLVSFSSAQLRMGDARRNADGVSRC